jgi:hypothetical protein
MSNGIIGAIGVFAVTLFLFVLRSLCLSPPQRNKDRHAAPAKRRALHEISKRPQADDNWPLWSEDLHAEISLPDRVDDGVTNLAKR